jgi:hypothetical protein
MIAQQLAMNSTKSSLMGVYRVVAEELLGIHPSNERRGSSEAAASITKSRPESGNYLHEEVGDVNIDSTLRQVYSKLRFEYNLQPDEYVITAINALFSSTVVKHQAYFLGGVTAAATTGHRHGITCVTISFYSSY